MVSSCTLIFAFSPMMWSQSIITEVYGLHAFLYSLIIDRFLLWTDSKKSEDFIFFGFLFGLAVSNHHLVITLVPAVAIAITLVQPKIFRKRDVILPAILFFLLGLSLYIYLPIRSLKNPAVDWGNPENLGNFLDHVLRRQYGISKAQTPFTLEQFFARLEIVILWLKEQFSVFLLITGIIGVYFTLIKDKIKGIFLATAYLMGSLGLTLVLNFRLEREQLSDVSVFFLTSYIPFVVLIGLGFAGIYKYFEHNKYAKTLWKIFLLLVPLWFLFQNLSTENESPNYLSLDYARNILQETEPGGIVFSSGDHQIFPLQYLQTVERRRPDVTICFEDGDLVKTLQHIGYNETKPIDHEVQNRLIKDFLEKEVPIYFPKKRGVFPGYRLIPASLNFKVVPQSSSLRFENPSSFFIKPDEHSLEWTRYPDALTIGAYHYFEGLRLHEQDKDELAVKEIERMVSLVGNAKETLNNAASTFAEWGYYKKAELMFKKAISINPNYIMAKNNLGIMYAGQGKWRDAAVQWAYSLGIKGEQAGIQKRLEEARKHLNTMQESNNFTHDIFSTHFQRGLSYLRIGKIKEGIEELQLAERSGELTKEKWNNLGSAYAEFRFLDRALICYQRATSFDPTYLKAKNNTALIYSERGEVQKAFSLFRESLRINPNQPQIKEQLRRVQEKISQKNSKP